MSPTTAELWKLLAESRLLSNEDCRRLGAAFAQSGVNGEATGQVLADWLVGQKSITRYQAKVLLARRPGPFFFGDYKVLERLDGRLTGAFRAVHAPTGQPVLLHFMSGADVRDPERWSAARSRAAEAARHAHPNLARVHQLVDSGSYKFIVLADLAGQSLESVLAAKKPLSPVDACRIVRQTAAGLAALHAAGGVHGEVCPANVWIDAGGQALLLGFPLAGGPTAELPPERSAAMADYLAPESQSGPPDARSDVYALGCMLRRLLAGRPAATTEALERLNPAVPKSLAQVVAFTMARAPAERYASAAALMEALSPYVPAQQAAVVALSREAEAYDTWLRRAGVIVEATPAAQPKIPTAQPLIPTAQPAIPTAQPAIPMAQPVAAAGVAVAAPAMAAVPELAAIAAAVGGSSIARQWRGKGKRSKSKLFFGLAAVGAIVALAIGGYAFRTDLQALFDAPPPSPDATANAGASAANDGGPRTQPTKTVAANVKPAISPDAEIITALGEDVWQSPTKGKPLELNYLPAGVQMFVALRPADLLAHEEGPRVLAALGPFGEFIASQLQALSGTAPENIEQAVFGLLPAQRDEDPPLVALVVRAKEAVPEESLLAAWNSPSEETVAGKRVFQNTAATYYIPEDGGGKLWALAPFSSVEDIEAWLAAAKKQQPLRKEMEALQRSSDAQRHLTVLFAINALKPGLFAGPTARARAPLLDFLSASESGEQPPAALFSLHLKDDDFFAEARLYAPATVQPVELAMRYQDAVNGLEGRFSTYLASLNPHPYSRDFLFRFPSMITRLGLYTRVGVDEKQAVLRCYLPSIAAHNLALGTQLAVLETGGGSGTGSTPAVATVKTAAEKLQERTTYVAPRGPFDAFAETLGDELGFRVVLVGEDFETAGITKNQQFDMNEQDKSYAEILKAALLKANPAGLLVFVIRKEEGEEAIFVTTRKAAEARKETIHEVFAAP